MTDLEREFWYA